ncbi:uncharacterized protein EV422DRAFT_495839, partial [Fimicolochytrium jonesii]|uniref:uncharacterized protein n=1 Tax=Fimicolochytrium jonesii TaxID=1396493 RepID=UPI0022FDC3DB
CHVCCMDFRDMNRTALDEAALKALATQHPEGALLGDGYLPVGTEVRMIDRSDRNPLDHLVGVVRGRKMKKEYREMLEHYLVKHQGGNELVPVEDVHYEWQIKKDGAYVDIRSIASQMGLE